MFCKTVSVLEHFPSLVCKCNTIYLMLCYGVTDPNQAAVQGLYILPVSPNALQMEKTGVANIT